MPRKTVSPVVKHYIDRALSAKTDNRPDFQQMIKDSEKRLFDIVLVWKLDRFARNRYDSAHYEYQLERNHVKLVSATEPISDSPAGIMVKVCSLAWLNTIPQNFLKKSCAA